MIRHVQHRLAAGLGQMTAGAHLLGGVAYGGRFDSDAPVLSVNTPVLAGGAPAASLLLSDAPVRFGVQGPVRFAATESLMFGVLESADASLATATAEAYRAIFRTLDTQGYPTLLRTWNYMADINAPADGLERYRQFNAGRQSAFAAGDRPLHGRVPAACALGVHEGPLGIAFLAGKMPFEPVENPRQISAYHYPPEYGELSPTFSRAGVVRLGDTTALLVSGTAAIVGHHSLHADDVEAQVGETLANLEALLAEAARRPDTPPCRLEDLEFTVYVRHAQDADRVMSMLRERVGARAGALCVQADVCRAELLVEIEAIAMVAVEAVA